MIGRALAVAALLLVYLLALGAAAPADVALGLALALAAQLATQGMAPGLGGHAPPLRRRVARAPRLVRSIAAAILRGTWQVAQYTLGRRPQGEDAFVELPLAGRSRGGVAAWGLISTLSPGEVVVDVDEERGVLVLHVLDGRDPEAIRRAHRRFYEDAQRDVMP